MAIAATPCASHACGLETEHALRATSLPVGPGVFRRLFDRIMEARCRSAEREVARFLERSGGRFTDATEREIMQHLTRTWRLPSA